MIGDPKIKRGTSSAAALARREARKDNNHKAKKPKKIKAVSTKNSYMSSDGQRYSSSVVERKINEAK